jgi:nitroreductase
MTDFKEIIRYATMAPSGHNTQPWLFSINKNRMTIIPDYSRRLPVVDPDDHALFISLGCALENLIIAAQHFGFQSSITYDLNEEKSEAIHVVLKSSDSSDNTLFEAIKHAHMNMPCEEVEVREMLQHHLGLESGYPLLLLRIGYSNPMPKSYRRPVADVLIES